MVTSQKDPSSDTEGERPVRERLRVASIAAGSGQTGSETYTEPEAMEDAKASIEESAGSTHDNGVEAEMRRPMPRRKRSHEEIDDANETDPATRSRHGRKRSRDGSAEAEAEDEHMDKRKHSAEATREGEAAANGAAAANGSKSDEPSKERTSTTPPPFPEAVVTDDATSPRTKRSKVEEDTKTSITDATASSTETTETETKPKDDKPAGAIPPASGFANTSTASPFGSLAVSSKSPSGEAQTSTSAFKASTFGALAASTTSGFGALGKASALTSFASPSPPAADASIEGDKPAAKSVFGGALGTSTPFTSAGGGSSAFGGGSKSGFGSGMKSGFGSLGGFGGFGKNMTSFASSGVPGVIGSAKTAIKAFGTPADDEADKSGDEEGFGAGAKSPLNTADEDKKDERFFEQAIETGEEEEETAYTCRCKLYNYVSNDDDDKKEWKERGLGVLRLNVRKPAEGDADAKVKARMVMRADGSHRVILNTPIQKAIRYGQPSSGDPPTNGCVYFMGSIDGEPKLEALMLKLRPQFALELHSRIADLRDDM